MNAYDPFAPLGDGEGKQVSAGPADADDWQLLPVPDDAPEPPRSFGKLGTWSKRYAYRRACGALDGYVLRFDLPGGKETRPLRWGRRQNRLGWHLKGWAGDDARPLYRLPELVAEPGAPVLLCEGEKAADAAAELLGPPWVVIASMNGSRSPHRSDWSPLAGRNLAIWPDNDEPGLAYASEAATLALKAGAASARIVALPDGLPDGWDLADPVPEGMELDPPELLAQAPAFDPDGEEQGTFRIQWRKAGKRMPGIYFQVMGADPDTGEKRPDWHWFGSHLEVVGYTRDDENREWGRRLAVYDGDGRVHHIAMPMTAMAGDGTEYRRELLRHGFVLAPGKVAREQLDIFLAMWRPKRRLRCVERIGWHGARFVLPDRTFGPGGETVILQASRPAKLTVAGSLADWKRQVAAPAVGNSRLAFSLAASFTGPLLHPAGQESGGFHFRGGSSIGKTSILHAARSTWGCPLGSWRTTDNAAETTAAGACDTLFLLDEVSQADARAVDAMSYMLGNGSGKSRATRSGGAREAATWRILFLSTGELSLADKIAESGKRARAGQSVRVIDIPADAGKGLGIFDALHGYASGAALADHLRRASQAHSGHAARAFLEQITDDPNATAETVREYVASWLTATLPPQADGQVGRVAARFALVAAAGELATALDILPWPAGEASAAASRCFADWLAARGDSGPEEITAGLRRVRAFLELHGTSRFEEAWPKDLRLEGNLTPETEIAIRRTPNRAGFRRLENEGKGENWEFYVLPEAWRGEVCAGFDAAAVARAMIAKGWMAPGSDSHQARLLRVPGVGRIRVYAIASAFLTGGGR